MLSSHLASSGTAPALRLTAGGLPSSPLPERESDKDEVVERQS